MADPTEAQYQALLREADRQCAEVLRCPHAQSRSRHRLRHCASGLVAAEVKLRWAERFPWLRQTAENIEGSDR